MDVGGNIEALPAGFICPSPDIPLDQLLGYSVKKEFREETGLDAIAIRAIHLLGIWKVREMPNIERKFADVTLLYHVDLHPQNPQKVIDHIRRQKEHTDGYIVPERIIESYIRDNIANIEPRTLINLRLTWEFSPEFQ